MQVLGRVPRWHPRWHRSQGNRSAHRGNVPVRCLAQRVARSRKSPAAFPGAATYVNAAKGHVGAPARCPNRIRDDARVPKMLEATPAVTLDGTD